MNNHIRGNTTRVASTYLKQPKFILNRIKKKDILLKKSSPEELLTPNRFDITAKLLYLRSIGSKESFGYKVYAEHIKLINGFLELSSYDKKKKIGINSFVKSFQKVHDSIKQDFEKAFSIPISKNRSIVDGAHRLATSIFFKKHIYYFNVGGKHFNYDYQFFEKKDFPQEYLDAMAIEYAKRKKNISLIFIWPTAGNKKNSQLFKILNLNGSIVFKKSIEVNKKNAWILVREIYNDEKWLGTSKSNFIGSRNKALWCFENNCPLKVYLYESRTDQAKIKACIRDVYKKGKHSIHITDTHQEAMRLSKFVFNQNSINWLNKIIFKNYNWFNTLFNDYKNFLINNKYNLDDFCIVGSTVMSIYGIRESRDIDFIHLSKIKIQTDLIGISDHSSHPEYNETLIHRIIEDPSYHFYYRGLKVISLKHLCIFKKKRGELKDLQDIKLIKNFINKINNDNLKLNIRIYTLENLKNYIFLLILKFRYLLYKYIIRK